MEDLAKLKPAFKGGRTVTVGNSFQINDGGTGMLLMSESKAALLGVPIMARILATDTTGVAPEIMGIGPACASHNALQRVGLTLNQSELVKVNEAFAAQYMACEKVLGLNRDITNVNGSGIALGHPVGCSGPRITTTLLYEMRRQNARTDLATLRSGGNTGTALVVARD